MSTESNRDNKEKKRFTSLEIVMIIVAVILLIPMIRIGNELGQIVKLYNQVQEHKENRGTDENIEALKAEIDELYERYYIGETPTSEEIEDGILKGYASAYDDPYGFYMSPKEAQEYLEKTHEILMGGIGIQTRFEDTIEILDDYRYALYVTQVFNGSPADEVGITEGDRVVSVDGTILTYNNSDDFVDMVRGDIGTDVTLGIIRNKEYQEFKMTRTKVESESVFTKIVMEDSLGNLILPELRDIKDGKIEASALASTSEGITKNSIGYMKIDSFSKETAKEFDEGIEELKKAGVSKVIIDVRNNGGGVVESVIHIADRLVPKGLIAELKYKYDNKVEKYESDEYAEDGQFIVLVNENSASASELLAKTLQEYGVAKIIGENTFGKGTVVQTIGLSNGGAIVITCGEYFTSKCENLEEIGVKPDIKVSIKDSIEPYLYKLPIEEDLQLMRAIEELS